MTTTKWSMDPTHSEVQFKVKHLLISNVTGQFKKFEASVETNGDDFSTAKINFSADIDSISTNNEQRDAHLKNADFFDAEKFPKLTFESEKLEKEGEDTYKLHGNLTMLGVTKPVTLNVELGGVINDPWGNTRAGFSVHGKINRKEFGMAFNHVSEAGGLMLGEEINVSAATEFVKQKQEILQAA